MQIPTHLKERMEQAEVHSATLVDVEVSNYPFFLNTETEISSGNYAKILKLKLQGRNKTITAVLLPSLL